MDVKIKKVFEGNNCFARLVETSVLAELDISHTQSNSLRYNKFSSKKCIEKEKRIGKVECNKKYFAKHYFLKV